MIRLYNKDCLSIMKKIPDNSVDLILTDPPYENDTHGGGNRKQWKNIHNNFIKDLSNGFNYEECFSEFLRICKTPNILIFCSNKQISKIMKYFEDKKLSTTLLVWYKQGYVPFANGKHKSDIEFIVYVRGKNAHWNNDLPIELKSKVLLDNWRIQKKLHSTQKSEDVITHLIQLHSFENDLIFDPFMGSCTTGVVCKKLKRNFIGCDSNKEYFNIAEERIKEIR